MNIQGIEILKEHLIYKPNMFGYISLLGFIIIAAWLLFMAIDNDSSKLLILAMVGSILGVVSIILCYCPNKTILNHPVKVRYDIEVIDENAWKELGPNYTVIEKIYDNAEIYIIEGDYVDGNS